MSEIERLRTSAKNCGIFQSGFGQPLPVLALPVQDLHSTLIPQCEKLGFDKSLFNQHVLVPEQKKMDRYVREYVPAVEKLTRPLRIAFILRSPLLGGAEWRVCQYAACLGAPNFESRIFIIEDKEQGKSLRPWLNARDVPYTILDTQRNASEWLEEEFRVWTPDIVQNLWKVYGAPTAVRGPWKSFGYITRPGDLELTHRSVLLELTGIFAVSALIGQTGLEDGIQKKVRVIRNGVDVRSFSVCREIRSACRACLGILDTDTVILWNGRMSDQKKRLDILRSLIERIGTLNPSVHFLVNGYFLDEKEEAAWKTFIHGRPVIWIRNACPDDAPLLNACADISLTTSDMEGLSLATLEAMAAGVPVVTTSAGGQQEAVIQGETGYSVPIGDIDALSERIIQLVHMPKGSRVRMGKLSRYVAAAKFSLEENIRTHIVEYLRSE